MGPITIRPIRPSDLYLLTEMHQRLSCASIYARFLQYRCPSVDELRAICCLRAERGAGFVATMQQAREIIVGLAYYVREAHTQYLTAEPGILVEDQFQGQGIGRRLWQEIHRHAQLHHVRQLRVLFAPSNCRLLHLLHTSGFTYQAQMSYELVEYLVALDTYTPSTYPPSSGKGLPRAKLWGPASRPIPARIGHWLRNRPVNPK